MSSLRIAAPRAEPTVARSSLVASFGVPVALGVLGSVLSMLGSWNVSLWTDEAATISAARRSTSQLWDLVHNIDAVHAVYYFFVHFWGGVFGWSPFSLRLPSALAAGVAVVGVWTLARVLDRRNVAAVGAIVLAILPRTTWMGVEARSFGPSAAIAVWATVVLVVAIRSRRRWWFVYAGLVAAGTALNIYVMLLVVAHGVSVLSLERRRIRVIAVWLAAAASGVLAAFPIVLQSFDQRGQLGDNVVVATTLVRQAVINQWFLGETPTRVGVANDGAPLWTVAALGLAAIGWALIALGIVTAVRGGGVRVVMVLLPWLFLPTVIVGTYSLTVSPLYNPRYFTFCVPAAALLIALGIDAVPRARLRIAAILLIAALAAPIYVSQRQETGKSGSDWSSTAAYIAARAEPGDGVYFAPLDRPTANLIERTTRNVAVAYPEAFDGLIDVTLRVSPLQDASLRGLSANLSATTDRLALVDRVWIIKTAHYPADAWANDMEILYGAGFQPSARVTLPVHSVIEYGR